MNFSQICAASTAIGVGTRLKELRLRRGLTLQDVARPLGVTRACISQWEHGRSAPATKYLERIADTLGTSVGYLLAGEEGSAIARSPHMTVEAPDIVLRARKDIAEALGVEVSKVRVEIDIELGN